MDIKAFVKKDIGKLSNPKLISNLAMGGGALLALLNMVKEKNDRDAMKAEVIEEVIKKMSSNE